MNKSIKYLLSATVAISMASCSTGYYLSNSQNVNLNQTQVVLSQANFRVVKQVKVTYVYQNLHTMRFYASQLKVSAYAALVQEANLTGAQTIINVTVEQVQRKSQNFWTVAFGSPSKYEQAIIVSGTVIEFLPEGVTPTTNHEIVNGATTDNIQNATDDQVINRESSSENGKVVQHTTISGNVQSVETGHILPQVDTNSQRSEYSLLEERYATAYPSFWKDIKKVRKLLLMARMNKEWHKVTTFLLSDNEKQIIALMQEIPRQGNINSAELNKLFIKYAG